MKNVIRQKTFFEYDEFVEKFKPKKTTDDCYTPEDVYKCILDYVRAHIHPLDGMRIVRPFWPGADYQTFAYEDNDVVIDNPPFSILAEIVNFYLLNKIDFFLFAPSLTCITHASKEGVTAYISAADITYANGAKVPTSFLTTLYGGDPAIIADGRLALSIKSIQRSKTLKKVAETPVLRWPSNIISSAWLGTYISGGKGGYLEIRRHECHFVRQWGGRSIFGGGFLISDAAAERAAAERAAAERAAAERAAIIIQPTPAEQILIQKINKDEKRNQSDNQRDNHPSAH